MPQPEKKRGLKQLVRDQLGAIGARDAGEQHLSGIRGAHAAGLLGAVERQRIGLELGAPECRLEALGKTSRVGFELARKLGASEPPRATRRHLLGGKHVALNLGERDRAFGGAAVGMEDRVVGVLPALVGEALLGLAAVFDEAIPVGIADVPSIQRSAASIAGHSSVSVASSPVRST